MSELNFPKNPAVGQEYTFNSLLYMFDGVKWVTKGTGYNPVQVLYEMLASDAGASFVGANGYDNVQAALEAVDANLQAQIDTKINAGFVSRFDRESLRRSYADAGYSLVAGSFEVGGTLVNANDVLLHEASGKAFSGPAGAVPAGTNPASGGFTDRSKAYDNPRKNFKAVSQTEYDLVSNASGLFKFIQGGEYFVYSPVKEFVLSDITNTIPSPSVLLSLMADINANLTDGFVVRFDVPGAYNFGQIPSNGVRPVIMSKDFDVDWMYNLVQCSVANVDNDHALIQILDTRFKMRNYFFDDVSYAHANASKGVAFFTIDNLTKSTSGYEFANGYIHRGRCILRAESKDANRQFVASDINLTGYMHGEDVYYGVTGSWSGNRIKGNYTVGICNRAIFIYGCSGGDVSYYCRETHQTSGALMIKQYLNSKVTNWKIKAHYGAPRGPVRFSAEAPAILNVENIDIKLIIDDMSQFTNTANVVFEATDAYGAVLGTADLRTRNIKIDYTGPNNVNKGLLTFVTASTTDDGYGVLEFTGSAMSASNYKRWSKNKYPTIMQNGSYMRYAELSDGELSCKVFPKFIDDAFPDIEDLYLTVIVKKDKTLRESLQKVERYYLRVHRSTAGIITYMKVTNLINIPDGAFNPTTTISANTFVDEYLKVSSDAPDATADMTVYLSRM